eukprot:6176569-Pleurochrysis_carterae.AAC.4
MSRGPASSFSSAFAPSRFPQIFLLENGIHAVILSSQPHPDMNLTVLAARYPYKVACITMTKFSSHA